MLNRKSKASQKSIDERKSPVHVHCSDIGADGIDFSADISDKPLDSKIDWVELKSSVHVHCFNIGMDAGADVSREPLIPKNAKLVVGKQSLVQVEKANGYKLHNDSAQPGKSQELKDKSNGRPALPNKLKYKVYLRDQGHCQYKDKAGMKCNEFRWLEVHHKLPVSRGGQDQLENLITICKSHHRLIHDR